MTVVRPSDEIHVSYPLIYGIDTYREGEGWTAHYPQYHSETEAETAADKLFSQIKRVKKWRVATYARVKP